MRLDKIFKKSHTEREGKKMLKFLLIILVFVLPNNAHAYQYAPSQPVAQVRNVYSTTPITTATWVRVLTSIISDASSIQTFDSSGQTMLIGYIPAGLVQIAPTARQSFTLFPGGNGMQNFQVPAGAAIWVKAVSGNATAGELDLNFFVE